jgi:hypothetical protein
MEHRRNYTKLDEDVAEENAIRKHFYDKMDVLGKQYKDVFEKNSRP